ncbi:putative inorganic phosphate cotransporter isoform X1 [Drosophila bipectinata]|uniref:putative inorganic phosphate cotransporter isoform X1 n=1 Tax=Drosophila bipectinata TaxID=42026 RepID=UPI001C8AFAE7|nr:putative inorganic phosphate cotransporter isoform X1 [Drosophila bipectinata]XP_017100083.2 putative inorganic phosphate cotransporter isoform X1 [Drosophila bipectinata]XP_043067786.1 putative inorganic phosphate cotransporter isoform X1 [Drosophila bipectinata]
MEAIEDSTKGVPRLGLRHVQAVLLFIGLCANTILQLNVGVAVVAMTNTTTSVDGEGDIPKYNWSEVEKSYILSSFYWGSALAQFPAGYLCKRFGSKAVLFWGTLGSSLLSALTPHGVYAAGWQAFCAIRLLQGVCQVTWPCIHQHLANWCPEAERTRLGAFAYTGFDCGNVLAMYAAGMIASSSLGWPGISYSAAALGLVWCVLWLLLGASKVTEARFITEAEKCYILGDLQRLERKESRSKKLRIPWKGIFTSAPVYALLCARCADTWGLSTMQQELPAYLSGVLRLDMKSNALFSSLPFLLMWGMCYVYLVIADVLLQKKWLGLTALRKTYTTIALWAPASIMLALGFVGEGHQNVVLLLITLSVGVSSAATIGTELNTMDLSPNYAGILAGIITSFTNVVALLTPLVVGVLVTDAGERGQWQVVFCLVAGVLFAGNVIFMVWGTAVTQPWNEAPELQGELEPEEKPFQLLAQEAADNGVDLRINCKNP